MAKPLKDGETKVIKPQWCKQHPVKVSAVRVDSDTPYVVLGMNGTSLELTDTEAWDLMHMLQKALHILPSSK